MSEAETVLAYEVRWLKKPDDETSKKSFHAPSRVTATNKAEAMSIKFQFADLGEWQVGDGNTDLLIQRWRYENGKEVFHEIPLKKGKEITRPTTNPKLSKEHGKAVEAMPDLPEALDRKKNGIVARRIIDHDQPKQANPKTIIDARTKEPVKRETVAERFEAATSDPGGKLQPKKSRSSKPMRMETETTTITKRVIRDDGAKKMTTKKKTVAKADGATVKRSVDPKGLKKATGSMTGFIQKMNIRENSFLFDAFQMLMKNPGTPVTFSSMMKSIYGNTKSESPLNLLIFNARKRLKDFKVPLQIATLDKNGERAYGLFAK